MSLRRAVQSGEMLTGFEELDGPTMSEVGRVSPAHLGVAAAQGLQMGASTQNREADERKPCPFTAHAG